MRFRQAAIVSAVVAAVLSTAACSGGSPASTDSAGNGVTELTFWTWVPAADKAVDLWNSENPDIQVNLELTPAGSAGTYAKIYAALKSGNGGPDVSQVEYQELPGFVLENGLVDLGPLGMDDEKDTFSDWQMSQSTFNDTVYAVPQASGPMGLFYRADIFDSLGIAAPTTWDEYADAAKTIHDANPSQYISTFPPQNSAWFAALAWQAGAQWFGLDGDTWTVDIDSPETLKVAEYWDGLREDGLIATVPDFANGWYSDLQNGNIVAWPSAQWGREIIAGNAPDTAGKWRAAPIPQWDASGDFVSANWGGSTTAVLKGTPHAEAAAKFAIWLNSDPESVDLLVEGGYGWPAAKDALESSTALNQPEPFLGGQNANGEIFAESEAAVDVEWGWIPTTTATYTALNDGFSAAIAGNGTFVDAVKAAQGATIKALEDKGLKARAGQ